MSEKVTRERGRFSLFERENREGEALFRQRNGGRLGQYGGQFRQRDAGDAHVFHIADIGRGDLVRLGGAGVRDYDGVVVVAHRIRGGPPDAVGVLRPGDKQGVDFKAAQDHVEFRLEERAETELAQDGFVRQRRELIDDLGAFGAGDTDACSLGKQRRAPDLHIAPIPAMLADHMDHAPAFRACAVEQFLDGGYGGLRALHAQRSFGKDEIVLHVDDDESNVHGDSLAVYSTAALPATRER